MSSLPRRARKGQPTSATAPKAKSRDSTVKPVKVAENPIDPYAKCALDDAPTDVLLREWTRIVANPSERIILATVRYFLSADEDGRLRASKSAGGKYLKEIDGQPFWRVACWWIAEKTGLTVATTERAVARLTSKGFLAKNVIKTKSGNKLHLRLNLPKVLSEYAAYLERKAKLEA